MVDAQQQAADAAAAPTAADDKTPSVKVIKRYANRKLYDTERSCYVTLDEISQMVKEGEEVQVVDNKSKDDLTAVTLAQIIVEEEKKGSRMPLKLLRNIIKSSNEALGDFYQKRVADPAKQMAHDVEERVGGLFSKKEGEPAPAPAAAPPPAAEPAKADAPADDAGSEGEEPENAVRAFVTSTTEAFESWQKKIDEQVKDTLSRMTHVTTAGAEVEALKRRIV